MNYAVLLTAFFAVAYIVIYFFAIKEPVLSCDLNNKSLFSRRYIKYGILLFVVFILEMAISVSVFGHKNDVALFKMWTSFGDEHKVWEYYSTEHYVDYPPVYLYILFIMGKVAKIFGAEKNEQFYLAFVKFVPILCDIATAIFIFKFAKSRIGEKKAFYLALISALNPAFISNSAVWGQCDSLVTLILVAMLFALFKKKNALACVFLGIGFMTKPQMIIYAPLVFFTILSDLTENFKEEGAKAFKKPVLAFLAFCLVLFLVPLLITKGNYLLFINKIIEALGKYPYATLNAPNFWGAFGLNWIKNSEIFLFLPIYVWGFVFITLISVIVGIVSFTVRDRKRIFYLAALSCAGIYIFAHTMHERYLYSLLTVLIIIFIFTKDKRIIFSYFSFSLSLFLCQLMALYTNSEGRFIMRGDSLFIPFTVLSLVNIVVFVYMAWSGYKMLYKNEIKPAFLFCSKEENVKQNINTFKTLIKKSEKSVPITKKDVLVMALITLVYSILAFYQLGSNNVPQTGYMPKEKSETVTIDLGSESKIDRVFLHAGWIARRKADSKVLRNITFYISQDGESYREVNEKLELKSVFKWHHLDLNESVRFIKLSFDEPNFYINEITFFGENEKEIKAVQKVISDNETAKFLIDEQEKAVYNYTWYDGTYFDEIYHPRTAYEHITNRYPYENTHPPLGKVIIALGMLIFGVNPFGWRFFGCLAGVIMVPVMYIFGKKMFKSSFWATICATLFTFDFMHLSQTRLATIDSFTVLFVMCSYLFMFLYIQKSFYDTPLKKTFLPLGLSGLFFGLSTAVKWQGIYAGAGLFVIFAIYIVERTVEFLRAKRERIKTEEYSFVQKNYKALTFKTICMAAVFFVVIPFVIYFLSYIPAMCTPDTGIKFFFTNQEQMLSYHANLSPGEPHPYSSSWWSWPLDLRPLYAYGPNRSFLDEGYTQKIASFGNPAVWWMTIPTILALLVYGIKKGFDQKIKIILIGFFAMYLPWVFISREAFIYHFFPCVIFVVLGIVYLFRMLYENKKIKKWAIYGYVVLVIVLFVMYYPILTGQIISTEYSTALRWLDSWPF